MPPLRRLRAAKMASLLFRATRYLMLMLLMPLLLDYATPQPRYERLPRYFAMLPRLRYVADSHFFTRQQRIECHNGCC